MSEHEELIFEISEGVMDKNGKVVIKPKVVGKLTRCHNCIYLMEDREVPFCGFYRTVMPDNGFCSKAVPR